MVTSSKVLTVTYGTFSCTLEGFDDPFTTLQKVAEYFRKLAARDRYFGGLPQIPDTDTLIDIAEQNSASEVDAEIAEDGIILRQTDRDVAEAEVTAPAEPEPEAPEAEAAVPETAQTTEATEDASDDDAPAIDVFNGAFKDTFFETPESDTDPAPESDVAEAEVAETEAAPRDTAESEPAAPDAEADAPEPATESPEMPGAVPAEVSAEPSPLRFFRSSSAPGTAEAAAEETVAESAPVELADTPDKDGEFEETLAAIRQNVALAGTQSAPPAEPTSEPVAEADAGVETASEPVAEAETADEAPAEPLILSAELPDTTEPEDAAETQAAAEDETTADETTEEAPEISDPPVLSSLSDEEEAELARDLEAVAREGESDASESRRRERRVRAEALHQPDDLAREEAALDRLLETTQSKMNKPEQARRLNALDQLKAAVAATEADQQMQASGAPETDEAEPETADLAAYRDDLRRATNNARLGGLTGANARPRAAQSPLILVSEQRIDDAADDEHGDHSPESPREVAQTDGNLALKPAEDDGDGDSGEIQGIPADAFSESTSFADFAERIGAFDLPDLLEAAAAYTSIVEGKSRFSRAQVMSKIARLDANAAFSKEAGLRAFGRLLREGKILRVQDGQFAISKASRFSIASRYDD